MNVWLSGEYETNVNMLHKCKNFNLKNSAFERQLKHFNILYSKNTDNIVHVEITTSEKKQKRAPCFAKKKKRFPL